MMENSINTVDYTREDYDVTAIDTVGLLPPGDSLALFDKPLDMWASVVEGESEKLPKFIEIVTQRLVAKNIPDLKIQTHSYAPMSFNVPSRKVIHISRGVAKVILYPATQGEDLYISWRAFVIPDFSLVKAFVYAVLSGFVAGIATNLIEFGLLPLHIGLGAGFSSDFLGTIFKFFIAWVVLCFVVEFFFIFYGWFKTGNPLKFFQEPLFELYLDDAISLTDVVHKSILHATDELGIDQAKLEVREPFFKTRTRPHI